MPSPAMALAKSFVFNARRANRVCFLNEATVGLDCAQRKAFMDAINPLTAVRNVNEHGFDGKGGSKPSMHENEGGSDETGLVVLCRDKILMGPLNLYEFSIHGERDAEHRGLYHSKNEAARLAPSSRQILGAPPSSGQHSSPAMRIGLRLFYV
jgi:hypothetical protein